MLVRKKDGTARPCVDYRRLNAVTQKDAFPLPRTEDCLDAVAGAIWFSTMDVTSAYNQIPIREEDVPKTAFVTKFGLYEFTTMPFGLCNAPATFQRIMELALRGLQWSCCLIYLDDVIIFGKSFAEHRDRLKMVLDRMREGGLKLKPSKCHFFQPEVEFLGHVISGDGVLPSPANVEKLVNWPRPATVTEVRGFVGLGSYYRRFVKNFTKMVKALVNLTRMDVKFEWTAECEQAFQELKKTLIGPDIMAYPRSDCPFILDTDACDVGIGAVLSQIQEGRERVIAYSSRSLEKAERNYCVTDKELLAVKYFIHYHKHHLLGRHFTVRTDHQALRWLFSLKEPKNRIARWLEILSAFHFTVEYRPGKQHGNADALSRCPNPRECTCPSDPETEVLPCGPCSKCTKKSEDMGSDLLNTKSDIRMIGGQSSSTSRHSGRGTVFIARVTQLMLTMFLLVVGMFHLCDPQVPKQAQPDHDVKGAQPEVDLGPQVTSPPRKCRQAGDGRTRPKLPEKGKDGHWSALLLRRVVSAARLVQQDCCKVQTRSTAKKQAQATKSDASAGTNTSDAIKSRKAPKRSPTATASGKTTWASNHSMSTLRKKQENDPDIGPIFKWKLSGKRPFGPEVCAASPTTRHYWNSWDRLEFHDGVLFRSFARRDGSGQHLQYITPREMQKEVLQQMHNSLLSGGHLGKKKTREKVLQRFYWFCARDDINRWVQRCDMCAANKDTQGPSGRYESRQPNGSTRH